ncbi:UDP-N-acetylmuramoyl-tripeptide--D-alanyl-D-alanine ligase [Carboxylicivirga marina]|uniref:UDP-N-acetylmuramoyl-tripeptide--D-alanyl-D-alanine ligase n=1 Tax=Carboxylicivirga marina TaxID=2800988 RepID=A0ABS1HMM3_9BACT|nr:UDP-N-acetylmuramoyl-tripeptide--D-alanyl-D-alanine ligase [Carboxylicivirga marina]MBK3518419.1 UDP-N-acetylmuramoyl-tripeptide--D-alanyl-D-alanine ligase [Carboxylicivirga marina]
MSQIATIHKAFLSSSGVSTDSRQVNTGVIFFALKGGNFDGNKYVKEVMDNGASFAVADDISLQSIKNVFVVDDVLTTLQELATYHRRHLGLPLIAITGTNGKTTTKELVAAVVSRKYKTKATIGNFNNHIGVPLTLLSMDKSIELGIVEMGANHIGEIELLCNIAEPDYGMITNVGKAHLEGFGSFEGVKTAKGEMYQYLQKHNGQLFINHDNEHLKEMAKGIGNRIEYGLTNGVVTGDINCNNPFITINWKAGKESIQTVKTNLIGAYNLENILSAICIGYSLAVDVDDINAAIEEYKPTNNRSQLIQSTSNKIIMDAYNANPSSMQVAIQNFSSMEAPNKVLILGGMKEMGDDCQKEHQKLVQLIEQQTFSAIYLIGPEFENLLNSKPKLLHFKTNTSLIDELKANPIKNSTILIKGSRSNKLEELLEYV